MQQQKQELLQHYNSSKYVALGEEVVENVCTTNIPETYYKGIFIDILLF